MSFQDRRRKILTLVNEFESLSVEQIVDKTGSSPATVRRDLFELAAEGLVTRTHGGAMKPDNARLVAFERKQNANETLKQQIGKRAAANVNDGNTIFMDCGSTVFAMCAYLKTVVNLRVITNSLPIVAELIDVRSISINLIGGELDAQRKAIHGDRAIAHINNYHADKSFIGIDGFTLDGLSSHSEKEAGITRSFLHNANKTYLLCDSSKIGKAAYLKIAPATAINYLISDGNLSADLKRDIEELGIEVQV